jgi:hypothetical protein
MPVSTETKKAIFNKLKKNLETLTPPMQVEKGSTSMGYQIIGNVPVPYGSTRKIVPGMFFAAIAERKDSITLHFFPCYMNPKMLEVAPNLTKCLKGKTCFHFKKEEQVNEKELKALLKSGIVAWKKMGYLK